MQWPSDFFVCAYTLFSDLFINSLVDIMELKIKKENSQEFQ